MDRIDAYLAEYGHVISSLDFSQPTPADDPSAVLALLRAFLLGAGSDPYERQRHAEEESRRLEREIEQRLGGSRRRVFRWALATARQYAPLREDGLMDVGLSYPHVRRLLRELGQRLVAAGAVAGPDDVYWLTERELTAAADALDNRRSVASHGVVVAERKAELDRARGLTPPRGIFWNHPVTKVRRHGSAGMLQGVGACPGQAVGMAVVVKGPSEFGAMIDGGVLVAPFTTPAWTPLFARAAAIVTDIGGPLSHGSIVAREYGIPAVLGTGDASKMLRTGQRVHVDGTAGTVAVLQAAQTL